MSKYGVFLGRFSPIHKGHQHIIDKILQDGLTPIVIVGSADKLNKNTPYHPLERIHMIKLLYPKIQVYALDDADCWDAWYESLVHALHLVVTEDLSEVYCYLT